MFEITRAKGVIDGDAIRARCVWAVLTYALKGAKALGLPQCGEAGLIVGKRCGRTHNIGGANLKRQHVSNQDIEFPWALRIALRQLDSLHPAHLALVHP